MKAKTIAEGAKGVAKAAGTVLALPWRALKANLAQLRRARETHRDNIVYIRDLFDQARNKARHATTEEPVTGAASFRDAMDKRAPGAPSVAQLKKRFLRQKRLALGTCLAFVVLSLVAIAHGNLLGIATLLSCLPLFFMAALSAQLRLWQLRTERLSKEEGGGLHDFIRTRPGWFLEVLDPEFKRNGAPE